MPESRLASVTRLLRAHEDGDPDALDALLPFVYDELRSLARQQRRRWQGDYTLNATALVHEAYLKLVRQDVTSFESRAHFLGVAAKAMRHVLINYAERRQAQKRGGDRERVSLGVVAGAPAALDLDGADELAALDEALRKLERHSERQSRIVECRFFGGMTIEDTAAALGVSPATVKRGWTLAQAWLHRELQDTGTGS